MDKSLKLLFAVIMSLCLFTFLIACGEEQKEPHSHTPSNAHKENTVEATCTEDGSWEEVIYCSDCNEEISRTQKTTSALGHKYEGIKCTVCGLKLLSEGLEYKLKPDGTYAVIGIGTCTDTEIIIPNRYNKKTVTEISESAFYNSTFITRVSIPDGVTSIGNSAFEGCNSLKYNEYDNAYYLGNSSNPYLWLMKAKNASITSCAINDNTKFIYLDAFNSCKLLTSITIPESVTSIGSNAFYDCRKLIEVINHSNIKITAGYAEKSYIGLYAEIVHNGETKIVNKDNYLFITLDGVNYLFYYIGNDTVLTFPESYNGESYVINDYAFLNSTSIKSVTLPNSVTLIEEYAFSGCSSLTSVTIEDGVTEIGYAAFSHCSSLASVTIGDSVTLICDIAFAHCSSLTSITIGNSVTSIGEYAFSSCFELVEVINHSSLNITKGSSSNGYVGYYAKIIHTGESKIVNKDNYLFITLDGTNYLLGYVGNDTVLTLPESYNGENYNIYKRAFNKNRNITSVTIPDSVISIGSSAFSNSASLTSVTISDSVTKIGDYAFTNCASLKYNEYDNAYYLGNDSNPYLVLIKAKKTSITSCILHNNTKLIVQSAFNNCNWLQYNEYDNAYYLANDNTPYALLIKPKNDFITSCIIHNDTTFVFDSAFYYLTSLTSVTIPDGITSIADDAFSGCYNLNSITIGSGVTSIGKNAFSNCSSLRYVYITDLAAWCNIDFEDFVSNPLYYGINLYLNGNLVTELIIPEGVTAIKSYAFYNCNSLTSVTIPDSVTSIGYEAFRSCSSLTSVTIPDSVTKVGKNAFCDCYKLKSITVADNNEYYKSIDGNLYTKDGKTLLQYAIGKTDTSFRIPDGVTKIFDNAFANCSSLTSVTISDSVTEIGERAFTHCGSLTSVTISNSVTLFGYGAFGWCYSLTSIHFNGTKADWNVISKVSWWEDFTGSFTVYCSDGNLTKEEA